MRIFLDANILFSYAKSGGAMRRFVDLLLAADHECWVDGFVVAEARRNLDLKAPGRSATLDQLVSRLRLAEARSREATWARLPVPEKDQPVLAAAINLGCDVLMTGDRTHFGKLYGRTLQGVTVHSPRSLAEIVPF